MPQVTLPADLDFAADASGSVERMNRAMANLHTRIAALETYKPNFDTAFANLTQTGLQRVTDALVPFYDQLTAIVSLGVLMNATSASAVPITGAGSVAFVLSAEDAPRFAFSGFMIAVSQADSRNAMVCRFHSYDRQSGTLVLDPIIAAGSGTHSDWDIMPCVPPFVPAAVIDPGSDGGGALAAVPYIPLA